MLLPFELCSLCNPAGLAHESAAILQYMQKLCSPIDTATQLSYTPCKAYKTQQISGKSQREKDI